MRVHVNGAEQDLPQAASIGDLLAHLRLGGKRVAVERNGDIVPQSLHAATRIAPGDRIEIVVAVGGG